MNNFEENTGFVALQGGGALAKMLLDPRRAGDPRPRDMEDGSARLAPEKETTMPEVMVGFKEAILKTRTEKEDEEGYKRTGVKATRHDEL